MHKIAANKTRLSNVVDANVENGFAQPFASTRRTGFLRKNSSSRVSLLLPYLFLYVHLLLEHFEEKKKAPTQSAI